MKSLIILTLVLLTISSCNDKHPKLPTEFKESNNNNMQPNSESVTYYLWPMIWGNGKVAGQVDHVIFTKVRASLTGGGYKCYWTLSFIVETFGWYREKSDDFKLILKNSQGGILATFPVNIHVWCPQTGHPETMYRQSDFNPDIYDLITNATQLTGDQTSTWRPCD